MKRYWQFLIVGAICLLVALLWAQPPHRQSAAPAGAATSNMQRAPAAPASKTATARTASGNRNEQEPLPGSSSSLPLLAVIGFGVLAGGITSALRTR